MIIERNISDFIVFAEESLLVALQKISSNKARMVLLVSASGQLEGVLTDGDVRRWITETRNYDVHIAASVVANRDFVYLPHDTPASEIEAKFSSKIEAIPLVDRHMHLVAIARNAAANFSIGKFVIGQEAPTFIIAEIGNNHNGDFELAKKLVDLAIDAGADCAKFQMRSMASVYRHSDQSDNASEDLGAQYTLDILAKFQLSVEDMFAIFDYCHAKGILPLCTPWDIESLGRLDAYGLPCFKIASADLTNHDLLEEAAATRKPLILSTGMSSESEISDAVGILRRTGSPFAVLHCNSTYPAPFKDVNLNYLPRLAKTAGAPVGYSGHERGIAVAIAAVAMGAKIIEKHFTVDRTLEGNDHRVSLLPSEFRAMVDGIREVEQALGSSESRRITQGELMNREVLAKSIVASRAIARGEIVDASMISVRSPGSGLAPYRRTELLGRAASRDMRAGDFFYPSDLAEDIVSPRAYRFRRPFGIPIRYHDLNSMATASNLDLVEFHLSYKDMEEDPDRFLPPEAYDLDLVVHSPELFSGDHILDLCSPDPEYRNRSIQELQRVVDLTRRLKASFARSTRPMIVVNAGGFSMDKPIPKSDRRAMYKLVAHSLSQVDADGVELLPQTMPPFPWHFGGQRFHNLFMTADDISEFCDNYQSRICLDISHSALACNFTGESFKGFCEQVAPFTAHMHIVDAEGTDGEGLQIGEGNVDFMMVAEVLDRLAPAASFIPEIWQGHKDGGAGFWRALDRLEQWF